VREVENLHAVERLAGLAEGFVEGRGRRAVAVRPLLRRAVFFALCCAARFTLRFFAAWARLLFGPYAGSEVLDFLREAFLAMTLRS
jgi:hypothetical protein